MAAEVAQVVQKCEEAKDSRQLMLNSCSLRKFPDAVFLILKGVDIQQLSLADNQFPRLPAKVPTSPVFASITSLDLSRNNLSSLPDTLPSLQQLSTINLAQNNFGTYPEILSQVPTLTHIDLSNNKVTNVDQAMVDSLPVELESVSLIDNPLSDEAKTLLLSTRKILC